MEEEFDKLKWCPKCEQGVFPRDAKDGKCPVCGTELTEVPPHTEPLPE